MVKGYLLLGALLLLLFLAGCAPDAAVICNKPYLLVGSECCLDSNENAICDSDDGLLTGGNAEECPELDCSLCAAEVVERQIETKVTVYVCAKNGEEVSDPKLCEGAGYRNAFSDYEPVTTNEDGTEIKEFSVKPACQESFNAAQIHFEIGTVAPSITIQAKEKPNDLWKDIHTYELTTFEAYLYAGICDGYCTSNVDFYLRPGKAYLVRAKFDYQAIYGEYQFSDEHIIDATTEGDYSTKLC